MIRTINSWRGLMAVAVVLFHCEVTWIYNVAVSGVTFFFISSGFLLALRHRFDSLEARRYGRFVLNHAMRLYPLHWLGLALLALIAVVFHRPVDWGATALNALLLHAWSPVHDVHYGINPVAWYMSALLFCYIIYPFLAHWTRRWRLRHKALAALALSLLLAAIMWPLDIPHREAVFVNPASHVVDMVTALALVHFYQGLKSSHPRVSYLAASLIEIGALLFLAAVIMINVTTTTIRPWEDDIIWLLPQGAILVALAFLNGQEGCIGRLLLCRPLQWLGSISFEVFVLQFVAFLLFNYALAPVAGHFGLDIYGGLVWFALPLLLLMSWVVNRCFTRPLSAWLKRKI